MSEWRKWLGSYGEKLVEKRYCAAGFELVERNFRCRTGEIDLIFKKGECLYFVEVRTKSSAAYGTAEESITLRKKATIQKVSQLFLLQRNMTEMHVQYDVVTVYIDTKQKQAWVRRYPHAF
ncbi:UPF0102 protein yraN [Caldalkalibacillus thermarum TA2.A1]|uniref:UPF0102 protein CathTA2_2334 n=1 Tax=Caldalkalibacillus thermarum (strain TA2.A1) TaxID=986075 RepID=F5L929_CALTT|nr:YraN family protein [Caldalkalibacillus thermarum]EGL82203.1 UPF0102 protein yraN [Caldalkalibacillus thermarum TA2.A1]QZT33085.1 YraN family protein [Caldalkalibacillus thermarum TA2.A1]